VRALSRLEQALFWAKGVGPVSLPGNLFVTSLLRPMCGRSNQNEGRLLKKAHN
jgi:hypothetical protein